MKRKVDIIYEDEYLVAVNKPANLLTIPDRFRHDLPNLFAMLSSTREELYTVHRLDKFTSGGILFAKDKETHKLLSQMFMDRVPEKYYIAVVDGSFRTPTGIVDEPLSESTTTRGKMLVHKRGKESKTAYEVLESFTSFSYVRLRIFSGRLHQIRVHMAHIGHPLVVDHLYGRREAFFISEIKRKKFNLKKGEEEKPLIERQPLHSHQLIFPHPISGKMLNLEFPIPKDIKALLNQLRKILKKK